MGKQGKTGLKKRLLALAMLAAMLLSAMVFAPSAQAADGKGTDIVTKYPIVLVHGAGFRDINVTINYWGRIPEHLESLGVKIYYGGTDGWCSVEQGAADLKAQIEKVLAETKSRKVNIIAHSKGGLEARYMISSLGMAGKVASLTTISTPHRGSVTVEDILKAPDILVRAVSVFGDVFRFVWGDKHPDFYAGVQSLRPGDAEEFNKANPNKAGVYYQSFAGEMTEPADDFILALPNYIVSDKEGPNDGMVTVESAKWGTFRGVLRGANGRGVSHADEADLRREDFEIEPILGATTILDFYAALTADLKKKGY